MTQSLQVREARPDDLPRILALSRQDSMSYYGEESDEVTDRQRDALAEITADAHPQLLVGEVDGRVVATCQVTWMRMLAADGGLCCQVEAVRTDTQVRGRGIGSALMSHVEDEARRRGAARLQLTTNLARTDAQRFYARLGFEASHVGMKKYL